MCSSDLESFFNRSQVVAVDGLHFPIERAELVGQRLNVHHLVDRAVDLAVVVVDDRDEVVELELGGGHEGLPALPFLHLAIAEDHDGLPIFFIEFSTGSLGQGLSVGLGMACAAKLDKKDWKTVVVLGDGELQEGQCWEAFMSAPKFKLDNLITIIDHNNGQIDGPVNEVMPIESLADKLTAFNWEVQSIDGHDLAAVEKALAKAWAANNGKPQVIVAKTVKGKGVSFMEHNIAWHGNAPKKEDADKAVKEIENGR